MSRARDRWAAAVVLATVLNAAVLLDASRAAAAARGERLDYAGEVLARPTVESLMERALRAGPSGVGSADTAALSAGLAAIVERLQGDGFLDARAAAEWTSGREPRLAVRVSEGPRRRFSSIRIQTAPPSDSAQVAATLGLASGAWASPRAAGEAIERAVAAAVAAGHPYAELGVSGWSLDSAGVELTVAGQLGPRVMVTGTRVGGLKVTRAAVVEKSMGRLSGLPYNPAAAEAARDRLARLGLFERVSLVGLEGESDWSRARLVYQVEELRYNRFEGVVGMQGQGGAVGLARLDLGNLLGTGRAMGLGWEGRGAGLSSLSARYAEPFVLGTPLRLEAVIDHQVQDTFWVQTRWGARGRLPLAGAQWLEAGYEQQRVVQSGTDVEEADLYTTRLALERRPVPPAAAGRRGAGFRLAASHTRKTERLRPQGARSSQASAGELGGEWQRPVSRGSAVSLELAAAGRFSTEDVLPLYERYPVGGAATLRGYDEEQFRVDRYALSRLEWRMYLGPSQQRVFLFWDHAWMSTRLAQPDGGSRAVALARDGVGFGLRLESAGGLVGLDYGLEPGRPALEGKVHLRLVSTF